MHIRSHAVLAVQRHPAAPHGLADQVRGTDFRFLRHHLDVLPLTALIGLLDRVHNAKRVQTVLKSCGHRQWPAVPRSPVVLILKRLPYSLNHADGAGEIRRRDVPERLVR